MGEQKETAAVQVDVTQIVKAEIASRVAAALGEPGVIEHFVESILNREVEHGYAGRRGKTMLDKAVEDMVEIAGRKLIAEKLKEMEQAFTDALEKRLNRNVPAMARNLADGLIDALKGSEHGTFKIRFELAERY